MCLLLVYEHRHRATKTFEDNYDVNFIIQVVHIVKHVLVTLYLGQV